MAEEISIETPLIYSKYLSDVISRPVYLKLELTQPSGSFKLRGISELCKKKLADGYKEFVGSSGGNAGLALAYTCHKLNVPCHLFVPTYISPLVHEKIKSYGANVTIIGHDWQIANAEALKKVDENPNCAFVHPYDHQVIWEGHSNMVVEIQKQLKGQKPSCIAASVGGGGMVLGILKGLEKTGWTDVPVLAMETIGSECFNLSIKENKMVEITLTSIAKSLGARSVAPALFEIYSKYNIVSRVLSDKAAVDACIYFLEDHKFLVEPACGVTLASVYEKILPGALSEGGFDVEGPIILIVCGGSDVTYEKLQDFSKELN